MRRRHSRDEELAPIRAGSSICHAQQKRLLVLELKVFILKLLPVYALAACAVALCKVAALTHEAFDDAVEYGAFVP